eukprot:TRINITY_DN1034_c0_g1_i3.p2 TRINITY_DN1034_c0_g1~~TRINITY_DN1034_c0_g1_i3.p2  ORF type:complete len:320 (-),score=96.79 TRINITY_DN1034_c0_g1_i3:1234-2193(-)
MTTWRTLCAAAVATAAVAVATARSTVAATSLSPVTFQGTYVLTKAGTSPTAAQARRCPVTVQVTATLTVANVIAGLRPVVVITTDWFRINGQPSCTSPCFPADVAAGACGASDTTKVAQLQLFSSLDGFNATSATNGTTALANGLEVDLAAADVAYFTGRTTGELRCGGGVTFNANSPSYWVYSPTAVPLSFDLPSSAGPVPSLMAGVRRVFFLIDDTFEGTWCGYAGASAVARDSSGMLALPDGVLRPGATATPTPAPVVTPTPPPATGGLFGGNVQLRCSGQDGADGADGVGPNGGVGGKGGKGGSAGPCIINGRLF